MSKILNFLLDPSNISFGDRKSGRGVCQVNRIVCVDGFSMSVQASATHYCRPRTVNGPWSLVEVGFPSEQEDGLMPFAEDANNPTDTVYGYVPVDVVDEIIEKHGGIKHA